MSRSRRTCTLQIIRNGILDIVQNCYRFIQIVNDLTFPYPATSGDNWNGIMKDTLREECDESDDCLRNCCVNQYVAPLFFVVFVLMAQFVLVNVVVAVLMKHLEESHKQVNNRLFLYSTGRPKNIKRCSLIFLLSCIFI